MQRERLGKEPAGGEPVSIPPFTEEGLAELGEAVDRIVNQGLSIQAFLLHGSGLRYIRVEDPAANLKAVGVGADLSHTLTDALTSLGNNGGATDYRRMVGLPSCTDPLDNWVFRGNTFTVSKQRNAVQLTLKGVRNATYRGESFADAVQQAFPER